MGNPIQTLRLTEKNTITDEYQFMAKEKAE